MQSIFAKTALTPEGWKEDLLVSIAPEGRVCGLVANSRPQRDSISVAILLPAVANLHSHTFQRAMAGLAESRGPSSRDSFWTWREVMYRFLDILSPEDVEAIGAFAFMEMLEAGFASVAEFHYLHHRPGGQPYDDIGELCGRIVAAASITGIGLALLPVYYAQGGVDGRPLSGGQARFGNDLDRFSVLVETAEDQLKAHFSDAALGIAPHSLRAVNPGDLVVLERLRPEAPFHMHIAEQVREVEEVLAARGVRPMAWLLDNLAVDRRWCLIHSTHMAPEETKRLAATGAVAGLCPLTEANLGDGIFDGARFAAAGGSFGIGSDSNILISVAQELRQLEYSQRLRDHARIVLADADRSSGRMLYDKALAGGAQALGREAGGLAVGNWADLVALDSDTWEGRVACGNGGNSEDYVLDCWIFASGNQAVTDVWSAGRHVVQDGRHVHRDSIASRYRTCLASLTGRL
jgi:formimidoylglutamate deiminase